MVKQRDWISEWWKNAIDIRPYAIPKTSYTALQSQVANLSAENTHLKSQIAKLKDDLKREKAKKTNGGSSDWIRSPAVQLTFNTQPTQDGLFNSKPQIKVRNCQYNYREIQVVEISDTTKAFNDGWNGYVTLLQTIPDDLLVQIKDGLGIKIDDENNNKLVIGGEFHIRELEKMP